MDGDGPVNGIRSFSRSSDSRDARGPANATSSSIRLEAKALDSSVRERFAAQGLRQPRKNSAILWACATVAEGEGARKIDGQLVERDNESA